MVDTQADGTWGTAEELPGTDGLDSRLAVITSLSCRSADSCSAGGLYEELESGQPEAYVVSEADGAWQTAQEAPGTAALNTNVFAAVNSVSCTATGYCGAGGSYQASSGAYEAFVTSYTPPVPPVPRPAVTRLSPTRGPTSR